MKIGRITGTVTATVKDPKLSGAVLLVANIEDAEGNIQEEAVIVADTCSAGPGDLVLLVSGSAARLAAKNSGLPVDMAAIAIVDHIDLKTSSKGKN
ncbi:EutN/CcmL family microcompartment protein [Hoeflea alexandrii]|uniref:EutN/CcmL family microcompartment protein n=1 Tax=Hoeflea alexandrii TaxID=288436 RepID=UPI0022B02FEA|nr:EutN/CcmL family microcompartment protein [Hoeflea alexandrii]MCZ4291709.1 EutN/CcmL family microcompartment protein [Hoeflea alexandrii]